MASFYVKFHEFPSFSFTPQQFQFISLFHALPWAELHTYMVHLNWHINSIWLIKYSHQMSTYSGILSSIHSWGTLTTV